MTMIFSYISTRRYRVNSKVPYATSHSGRAPGRFWIFDFFDSGDTVKPFFLYLFSIYSSHCTHVLLQIWKNQYSIFTQNKSYFSLQPVRLLKPWVTEFLTKVELMKPQFIALHMQEVGGKTYEKSMDYVQEFIRILCESPVLAQYSRIRIYLDEDYNSAEHFTVRNLN